MEPLNTESKSPIGLETIQLDEGGENLTRKKCCKPFSVQEDIILIRPWLNVSKDAIIGVNLLLAQYWPKLKRHITTTISMSNFQRGEIHH